MVAGVYRRNPPLRIEKHALGMSPCLGLRAMNLRGQLGEERQAVYFKQFYLGCLAHASYLIGSEGEAVVVDPQRDVDQYIDAAAAQNLRIKYIIETHLHAD